LTGSANRLRLPATEDSLAGRAESIDLFGLSQGELTGHRERFIDRAFQADLLPDVDAVAGVTPTTATAP
jgi:hypothetical protein